MEADVAGGAYERRCRATTSSFLYQIKVLLDRQEKLYDGQSELQALLEDLQASGEPAEGASAVAVEDWSGTFERDSEADDIRFNVFGITSYRANQRGVINAVLSGRDALVIMAAGGGKSLCYQLPAVLREGVALVVSPLLYLIRDQVMGLIALGVPAYMLTSTTSKEEAHCCSQWVMTSVQIITILGS